MAEYIELETTYADFENCNAENPKWTPIRVKSLIARQPTADVAPVRNGRWIEKDDGWGGTYYDCSACGESWTTIDGTPGENNMNYCPNCGAKMDGDG